MNISDSLFPLLLEEILKLEQLTQQLCERNAQYLSTFPSEISMGIHYTLKKDARFFSDYGIYTSQIQKIIHHIDRCILSITNIMHKADRALQISPIRQGDQVLRAYHTLLKSYDSLLEKTQSLITGSTDTINGSKLFQWVKEIQYKTQHFSAFLLEISKK